MSATTSVGDDRARVDAVAKVTGAARYSGDRRADDMVYACVVQSTIARGTIASIDTAEAAALPGVIDVLTHESMATFAPVGPPMDALTGGNLGEELPPLSGSAIHYYGQVVAVVLAETFEDARAGAALVRTAYITEQPRCALIDDDPQASLPAAPYGQPLQASRGDVEAAFRGAAARVQATYETPTEHHVPMELHVTVASWDDQVLTVHEGCQAVVATRNVYADMLGLDHDDVHVLSRYVGGGFGSKGATWPYSVVAAVAARRLSRPVKLTLTRSQTFALTGHRPRTRQRVELAASEVGVLRGIRHLVTTESATVSGYIENCSMPGMSMYACPAVEVAHRVSSLDLPAPTFMRTPGEAPASFALESAMDELAHELRVDPVELRRRNDATVDPASGAAWSSRDLESCVRVGAERIGWADRSPVPGSVRRDGESIGLGMALAAFPGFVAPAYARARIDAAGTATIWTATTDIGTGSATILGQIAADELCTGADAVQVELGDSRFPASPGAFGSLSTASVGAAVQLAARAVRDDLVALAAGDPRSPLHGSATDDITLADGVLVAGATGASVAVGDVLERCDRPWIEVTWTSPPEHTDLEMRSCSFGAVYARVAVDAELGTTRVEHLVGVYDVGRVINPRTLRSQLVGGMIFGIGMALTEETVVDEATGAYVNASLADYHIPVNADIHRIEAHTVGRPDPAMGPLGARGAGEISNAGTAAAIANAIFNATGVRVRDLPILPDKLRPGAT